ncbi:MAG: hypothetical protein M4579_002585 [Chaenotheca gracillima]|nr:MAG: hypothetical protein M4579_002585 [Chaenotheca gracillima]
MQSSSQDVDSEDVMFPPSTRYNPFTFGRAGPTGPGAFQAGSQETNQSADPSAAGWGQYHQGTAEDESAPGYAWTNRRALDERARALDTLVDAQWSLQEIGDPFDESDMIVKRRKPAP